MFAIGDLLYQNLPFQRFYSDCLHNGESFLWSPTFYSGFYLYCEGQTRMLHPRHLLFYRFIPLLPALGIQLVASYVFMAAGCYLFFRKWELSPSAALFGAFLFTFGGTNLAHLQHINLVAVTAHLPWMLLAMEGSVNARTWRSIVFVEQRIRLAGRVAGAHWASARDVPQCGHCRVAFGFPATERGKFRPGNVVALFGSGVLGLVIGAVQLLPTLDVARDSTRDEDTGVSLCGVFAASGAVAVDQSAPISGRPL